MNGADAGRRIPSRRTAMARTEGRPRCRLMPEITINYSRGEGLCCPPPTKSPTNRVPDNGFTTEVHRRKGRHLNERHHFSGASKA